MARRQGLHYAWIVAGITFLVLIASAGVRSTPSVLIIPLEREFGWSRATISLAVSLNILLYGLMGPFAAAIMARFGLRRTVVGGLVTLAIGVGLTSQIEASWQLILLWGLVVGMGTGVIALVLAATVVSRWFTARRGLVMGVLTASTATGQLVFLPLLAHLAETIGWRAVSWTVAGVAAALILPVILLMRDRPADLGLAPYGEDGPPQAPPKQAGNPIHVAFGALREGLANRDFWLLGGSFFICGASTNGLIGTHLIPACVDHGIAEETGATLLAAMGIFDFLGTTASGWLSDRYDNRKLLAWYYGLRGLSLMFLPFAFDWSFYGLSIFAVFYGLDWIATVPPTVRLAAQSFGQERSAIMFGWISASHQLGAAAVAGLAGLVRTELGDYLVAFICSGLLCLGASVMVLFIGRRPRDFLVAA
jgi:predicted MFS family arabinose efflux permease